MWFIRGLVSWFCCAIFLLINLGCFLFGLLDCAFVLFDFVVYFGVFCVVRCCVWLVRVVLLSLLYLVIDVGFWVFGYYLVILVVLLYLMVIWVILDVFCYFAYLSLVFLGGFSLQLYFRAWFADLVFAGLFGLFCV